MRRILSDPYQCVTALVDIHQSANLKKRIPQEWISSNKSGVTQAFIDYARPLIQAELTPLYIAGLPRHTYIKE